MLTNPELSDLYLAMTGLDGDKPFECTGTETEVRAAIVTAAQQGSGLPALNRACATPPSSAPAPSKPSSKTGGRTTSCPQS